ncbi:hypothetical protein ER308_05925 [Egibacter rhizosphaerae]|uniref:AtpZ/AtpI family protein n=2 Tax=Egibacter rhizosphaerae TaxID=1670831 RepID=A0A411YL38_9ACTN|nr:hypothetical protein ER308_05925 [Egibacter rhizosphaerae]
MSGELLSGLLIWGGVGWLLDSWLGTGPWLFVIGALVGNGTGLWLMWWRSTHTPAAAGTGRDGGEGRTGAPTIPPGADAAAGRSPLRRALTRVCWGRRA